MFAVYRTLSLRYLARRWFRAVLIVASIALGVATLVATRALNETMTRAGYHAVNPLAGTADLLVSNSGALVDIQLVEVLRQVEGVRGVFPRLFEKVTLPDLDNRPALLMGVDIPAELGIASKSSVWGCTLKFDLKSLARKDALAVGGELVKHLDWETATRLLLAEKRGGGLVGVELEKELSQKHRWLARVQLPSGKVMELVRGGTVEARGPVAALAGHIIITEINSAAELLQLPEGRVHRIDLALEPGADRNQIQRTITQLVAGKASVHTPEEQNQMVQNVMSSMQTGFGLCGVAALVVGMFLVYNALSVSVAERRHEIGILLALGATRNQVQRLFAGEAALLGLGGSLLGIPLGIGLAYLGLDPVQNVLRDIFYDVEAHDVEVSTTVLLLALLAGMVTAVLAALLPAIAASHENPAEAVRRIPPKPTLRYRLLQIAGSLTLMLVGLISILLRHELPWKFGIYGGLVLVLLGALLATPLLAALAAWVLQPLARQVFGIEGRLAADNLVRAPARTGLVIAALTAGVSLVMQTAGIIRSNREALRDWVQDSIGADLIVTSGSPVGAGAPSKVMEESLAADLEKIDGVRRALPIRSTKVTFNQHQILLLTLAAGETAAQHRSKRADSEVFRRLGEEPDTAAVSENFQALHGIHAGDTVTLLSPRGLVSLKIVGTLVDYSWNHGTLILDRTTYLRHWEDRKVDVYDIYLRPGADDVQTQETILRKLGAAHALVVQTRPELQRHIDGMIERLYGIAYGQLVVVMFVAALGVVTALLISVLQRRREMGLLRAIGASQAQVVRSVLAEATLMGLIGTGIGLVVGIPMEWYVLQVLILEESGYYFPLLIPWSEGLVIAASALVLATLAGLGPALYAVRQRIPEAIAYE